MKTSNVRLNVLDYEVLVQKDTHRHAGKWCEEQYGERWNPINNRSGRWCMFWAGMSDFDKYRFCFVDEKDYMMFLLRWS